MNDKVKVLIVIGVLLLIGTVYYAKRKSPSALQVPLKSTNSKDKTEDFYPSLVYNMANSKFNGKLPRSSELVKFIKSKTPVKQIKQIYSSGQPITEDEQGFVITNVRIIYRQGETSEWKSIGGVKLCRQQNDGGGTCVDLFPGGTYQLPIQLGFSEHMPLIIPFTPATIIVSYPPDFSTFLESDFLIEITRLVPIDDRSTRGLYDTIYSDSNQQYDMIVPDTNKHYAIGTYLPTHNEYNITGRERRQQQE